MHIGIIGCGNISPTYFNSHKLYNNFKVIACADIDHEVAIKSASEYGVIPQNVDETHHVFLHIYHHQNNLHSHINQT